MRVSCLAFHGTYMLSSLSHGDMFCTVVFNSNMNPLSWLEMGSPVTSHLHICLSHWVRLNTYDHPNRMGVTGQHRKTLQAGASGCNRC
jgi:hypothetical protein